MICCYWKQNLDIPSVSYWTGEPFQFVDLQRWHPHQTKKIIKSVFWNMIKKKILNQELTPKFCRKFSPKSATFDHLPSGCPNEDPHLHGSRRRKLALKKGSKFSNVWVKWSRKVHLLTDWNCRACLDLELWNRETQPERCVARSNNI